MAKRKRKRSKKDRRLPILPIAGVAIALSRPAENLIAGNYMGALAELGSRFTGYNFQSQVFDPFYSLKTTYLPLVAGALGSKAMTALGVNRTLKKVPFVGKWIKL